MKLVLARTPEDDAGGQPLNLAGAIAEFYREFPVHKRDVFILDHQAFETGQAAIDNLAAELDSVQQRHPEAKMGFAKSMARGAFEGKMPCSVNVSESLLAQKPDMPIFARIVVPAGEQFTARAMKSIFVSSDLQSLAAFPSMPVEHNNTEMWQRYVLDHELGHALTMLSIDKQSLKSVSFGNKAECEADAYAMIRHFQRYGADSSFPAYISDVRNMNAVHKGDVTHWTSRAIDRVIELNAQGALQNLTPEQSRDLAISIALQTHLSADAEINMTKAFAETRRLTVMAEAGAKKSGNLVFSYVSKVAEIGAETKSPAVHEACNRYISTVALYTPRTAQSAEPVEKVEALAENVQKMKARQPVQEPVYSGLGRAIRDALIDVQSGVKRPPNPPRPPGGAPRP